MNLLNIKSDLVIIPVQVDLSPDDAGHPSPDQDPGQHRQRLQRQRSQIGKSSCLQLIACGNTGPG